MQEGYINGDFDLRGDFVHGIGADEQKVCTRSLNLLGSLRQNLARGIPLPFMLEFFNFLKIDDDHSDLGRVQPTQFFFDEFVNLTVVSYQPLKRVGFLVRPA